jgi:hypothetical protein
MGQTAQTIMLRKMAPADPNVPDATGAYPKPKPLIISQATVDLRGGTGSSFEPPGSVMPNS